jgi:hypothetical protein
MPDIVAELAEAIDRLNAIEVSFPFSQEEAQAHFNVSLLLRRILASLPNQRLKDDAVRAFVAKFGRADSVQRLFELSQK